MTNIITLPVLLLLCIVSLVHSYGRNGYDPLGRLIEEQKSSEKAFHLDNNILQNEHSPVYIGPQDGLKEADKIVALPGQPDGESLNQYSGYVTVDPTAGRALFYYFVESQDFSSKPLVLWLNGGNTDFSGVCIIYSLYYIQKVFIFLSRYNK